jgi:triosephosphate isomerase
MAARRPLIAGNWKMHGSVEFVREFCNALGNEPPAEGVTVLLLPPVAYLGQVVEAVAGTGIECGAQNAHVEPAGAFTGEIAPEMVRDLGGRWLLIGHSERRQHFGESDELLAAKFEAALRAGLTPVFCVGETTQERQAGRAEAVVCSQIQAVAGLVGHAAFVQCVLAYEPVWAIGTGATATPGQAQAMHRLIRREVAAMDQSAGSSLRLLYGGSMNAENAAELLGEADIDGGLIGGASLQAAEFLEIVRLSSAAKRHES